MIKLLRKLLAYPKSRYTQIVLYKSYVDLMAETSRFYIGYLWWIVEPVIDMGVYYVVFGLVLSTQTPEFIPFLLVGTVIWRWKQTSVLLGANAIHAYRHIIDQVYVPKMVFPTVSIIVSFVKFLIVFSLLVIFLLLYGFRIDITWTAIPILFAIELLFICSITYVFAAAVPFFPDLRLVLDSIFKVLLFVSGIFYPLSSLPAEAIPYLRLNPAVHLINAFRDVLIHNKWPEWQPLLIIAVLSTICTLAGIRLISRYDTSYAKLSL